MYMFVTIDHVWMEGFVFVMLVPVQNTSVPAVDATRALTVRLVSIVLLHASSLSLCFEKELGRLLSWSAADWTRIRAWDFSGFYPLPQSLLERREVATKESTGQPVLWSGPLVYCLWGCGEIVNSPESSTQHSKILSIAMAHMGTTREPRLSIVKPPTRAMRTDASSVYIMVACLNIVIDAIQLCRTFGRTITAVTGAGS